MYKLRNKRNQGITLIALVITIIVLLILAAISITMLTGDNSILKRAAEAKERTEIAQEKELANLTFTTVEMELAQGKKVDDAVFQTMVDNNFNKGNAEGIVNENSYIISVKKTGNVYNMDADGNISELDKVPIDFKPGVLEGKGTVEEPYVINSIEDLVAFSYNVNKHKLPQL